MLEQMYGQFFSTTASLVDYKDIEMFEAFLAAHECSVISVKRVASIASYDEATYEITYTANHGRDLRAAIDDYAVLAIAMEEIEESFA